MNQKSMFSNGKNQVLTHWEFCVLHRSFGLRKSPGYLYQLFDVLPKQTTCEIKTSSSTSLYSTMFSWWIGSQDFSVITMTLGMHLSASGRIHL